MCIVCMRLENTLKRIHKDVGWEYNILKINFMKCLPNIISVKLYIRPTKDWFWSEYNCLRLKGHLENAHGYTVFLIEPIASKNVLNLFFTHMHKEINMI